MTSGFARHVFRTARGLTLLPYNRLADDVRRRLASSTLAGDGFGVAMPADGSGRMIEVDTETALLLHVLEDAGPLPDHVLGMLNEEVRHRLSDFVLSGLLELREGARFVSGIEAERLLGDGGAAADATGRLSHDAIEQLFRHPVQSPRQVAQRLYNHNRVPGSRRWRRRLADDGAFLRLASLDDAWRPSDNAGGWHYLSRASRQPRRHRDRVRDDTAGPGDEAKLYVSVAPEDLPAALATTARILKHHDCDSFKAGRGVDGILRPDKLVAYFPSLEALQKTAGELAPALSGLTPQGVPFTAAFTSDGLLSWGVDPAADATGVRRSWRQWVVERIAELHAEALAQMSRARLPDGEPDHRLAVRWLTTRLQLDGIDTHTFKPRQAWITENR